MRKFILRFTTVFCALMLVSCEQTPDFTINGKQVGSITHTFWDDVFWAGTETETVSYEYDNKNRIKKCDFIDHLLDFIYSDENTINIDFGNDIDTIYLNNDGTIKEAWQKLYSYKNGYLKTETSSYSQEYLATYNWENGNLKSIVVKFLSGKFSGVTYTTTYEYSTISNKPCSIDLFWIISMGGIVRFDHMLDFLLHNAGRFGKVPDKLISSYTITSTENNYTVNFTYETDFEGYVTKIYGSIGGAASKLLYEIEYLN